MGDTVRVRSQEMDKPAWPIKAKVIKQLSPRSYSLQTENGKILRRNRHHILPSKEVYLDFKI